MAQKSTVTETREETRTYKYSFVVNIYPKVVLVVATTRDSWSRKRPVQHFLVSKATYNKYKDRKSMRWVFSLSRGESLVVVSKAYLRHYKAGKAGSYNEEQTGKPRYSPEKNWAEIIESGQMGRVVYDNIWLDGLFYEADGKPILRMFHFDYARGGIRSGKYEFFHESTTNTMLPWLRKKKGVSNVVMGKVPYHNADYRDEQVIEFDFTPTPQFFMKLIAVGDIQRMWLIEKKLGIARFKRAEEIYSPEWNNW